MENILFDELAACLSQCPVISDTAAYWFFRTEGGYLYESFISQNCIAIGHPSVTLDTIKGLTLDDGDRKKLSRQIRANEPTNSTPGLSASQLLRFVHEMKSGDYVIIPSHGSRQLTIGVLTNKQPFEGPVQVGGKPNPNFNKRRGVRWLKRVPRSTVNPNLYKILFSHQTITNITECSQWIDTLLYDFFRKGAKYHFVLDVARSGNINARDLFSTGSGLLELGDEFAAELGIKEDSGDIDTRINLNSPGEIELITTAAQYIFVTGLIVVGLTGGTFKGDEKKIGMNINIHTDGLITALTKFLNARKKRQLLDTINEKVKALKIKNPDDITKVLDHINKDVKDSKDGHS
ncbi:MAG TPA: hypothetical protein VH413_18600 [Verrucomicrobiae bacterium]|jgi:hypothetical protein|nr:hypothetical protein [Verrucomicrobiae bacterium]